jgi:putative ABC transport system permease protein
VTRYLAVTHAGVSNIATVIGVRPSYQQILRLPIERGRFLTAMDERTGTRLCVLGAAAARELFGHRDAVGDYVRVAGEYFEVVGVLRALGTAADAGSTLSWRDINHVVFVPIGALTGRTLDVAPTQPVDEVWLQVSRGELATDLGDVFQRLLASRHAPADFAVVVPRELLAERQRTQRTFGIVVGSVAAMTLLVGGIGIMNIMLTSVMERTREIGVRRTVGATRRDVGRQFLAEALLMTLSGGAIGIVMGVALSWAIARFAGWRTHVSLSAIALGFVVSMLVGVAFGLYPAIKAARLEPVDAMRYE